MPDDQGKASAAPSGASISASVQKMQSMLDSGYCDFKTIVTRNANKPITPADLEYRPKGGNDK